MPSLLPSIGAIESPSALPPPREVDRAQDGLEGPFAGMMAHYATPPPERPLEPEPKVEEIQSSSPLEKGAAPGSALERPASDAPGPVSTPATSAKANLSPTTPKAMDRMEPPAGVRLTGVNIPEAATDPNLVVPDPNVAVSNSKLVIPEPKRVVPDPKLTAPGPKLAAAELETPVPTYSPSVIGKPSSPVPATFAALGSPFPNTDAPVLGKTMVLPLQGEPPTSVPAPLPVPPATGLTVVTPTVVAPVDSAAPAAAATVAPTLAPPPSPTVPPQTTPTQVKTTPSPAKLDADTQALAPVPLHAAPVVLPADSATRPMETELVRIPASSTTRNEGASRPPTPQPDPIPRADAPPIQPSGVNFSHPSVASVPLRASLTPDLQPSTEANLGPVPQPTPSVGPVKASAPHQVFSASFSESLQDSPLPLIAASEPQPAKRTPAPNTLVANALPPTFTTKVPTLLETPRQLPLQNLDPESTSSQVAIPTGPAPTLLPKLASPNGTYLKAQGVEVQEAMDQVQRPTESTTSPGAVPTSPILQSKIQSPIQNQEALPPGMALRALASSTPEQRTFAFTQEEVQAKPVPPSIEAAPIPMGAFSATPDIGDTPSRPGPGNLKPSSPTRVQGKASPVLSEPLPKADSTAQPVPESKSTSKVEPASDNRGALPSREVRSPAVSSNEGHSAPPILSTTNPLPGSQSTGFALPLQPANPANTPTPLTPAAPAHPVAIQVGDSLKWILRQANPSAELQLHPENLGKVTIQLRVNGTEVHARVWASEASTLPVLQDHRAYLEVSLRQQGLQLGSFDLQQGHRGHQPQPQMPSPTFITGSPETKVSLTRQETPIAMAPTFASSHRIEVMA